MVPPYLKPFLTALDAWRENLKMVALAINQTHRLDRPGPFLSLVFVDLFVHLKSQPLLDQILPTLAHSVECIIYATVYRIALLVASLKQGVAFKILLCYVLPMK